LVEHEHGVGALRDLPADLGPAKCRFMASTLTEGITTAAPTPRSGQTAPNK
jgi:hypothetical protein